MKKLIHKIAKFIFPSHCVVCHQASTLLCFTCKQEIPLEIFLENIFDYQITSAVSYKNKFLKKLFWYGKYKHSEEALEILASFLEEALLYALEDSQDFFLPQEKIVLVPVPMSPKHFKSRGKNHLSTLIKIIVTKNPDQFIAGENIVGKIKETKTQVQCKNRTERLNNLKNAFALKNSTEVSGKIVCLIDDIITTGTTLTELSKEVNKGQPKKILAATIAHG